jgi:hypothetical protein
MVDSNTTSNLAVHSHLKLFRFGVFFLILYATFLFAPYHCLRYLGYEAFNIDEMDLPRWAEYFLAVFAFFSTLTFFILAITSFFIIIRRNHIKDTIKFYFTFSFLLVLALWCSNSLSYPNALIFLYSAPFIHYLRSNCSLILWSYILLINLVLWLIFHYNAFDYFFD